MNQTRPLAYVWSEVDKHEAIAFTSRTDQRCIPQSESQYVIIQIATLHSSKVSQHANSSHGSAIELHSACKHLSTSLACACALITGAHWIRLGCSAIALYHDAIGGACVKRCGGTILLTRFQRPDQRMSSGGACSNCSAYRYCSVEGEPLSSNILL